MSETTTANSDFIHEMFNKKFSFSKNESNTNAGEYVLPPVCKTFTCETWTEPNLQNLKETLNSVKSKLNNQKIEIWSEHTRFCNPAGTIVAKVRDDINGEFVTQAWCKFYEIISNYPIISPSGSLLKSLHVCEAPGSFVAALNHYLAIHHCETQLNWRATTLNPYCEGNAWSDMITDDRFIQKTLDNWDFGRDWTGNIMHAENLEKIKKWAENSVDIATADGSIDCLSTPERQEEKVSALHMAEVATCLHSLKPGGSFVLKMFTFFECSSVNLLYFLCCVFENVHVFKPAVSKEGNSEVYVICQNYLSPPFISNYLDSMYSSSNEKAMFQRSFLPDTFITQIENCCKFFMNHQIAVIERNIATFNNLSQQDRKKICRTKELVANFYINHCKLEQIDDARKITFNKITSGHININPRRHVGSYEERQMHSKMTPQEKVNLIQSKMQQQLPNTFFNDFIKLCPYQCRLELKLLYAQPITKLYSSKFTYVENMKIFLEVCSIVNSLNITTLDANDITESQNNLNVILDINRSSFLFHINDYSNYEKNIILKILNTIKNLPNDNDIVIKNLLILSHTLAGILFMLKELIFENILLKCDGSIVLQKKKNTNEKVPVDFIDFFNKTDSNNALVNVLDYEHLYEKYFHKSILQYNTAMVFIYCLEYLNMYETSA